MREQTINHREVSISSIILDPMIMISIRDPNFIAIKQIIVETVGKLYFNIFQKSFWVFVLF